MRARRGNITDEYVEDGQAAVLVGTDVIVLSPLATALLALLDDDWADVRDVTAGLVRSFGTPPEGVPPEDATVAALRALAVHGLVELDEIPDFRPER